MSLLDMDKLPVEAEPVYVKTDFVSPEDRVVPILKDSSKLSDAELYNEIKVTYPAMLTECFISMHSDLIRGLFMSNNVKFLSVLASVMQSAQLMPDQRVYMNKIIYSAFRLNGLDEYTMSLIVNIGKSVNRDTMPALVSFMPENVACHIAVLRNSSFKDTTNVKRVNKYLTKCLNYDDNTEKVIVMIYDALFTKVTSLFEGTMFDVVDKLTMSDNEREIYATENLALLDVLESMPSEYIEQVLKTYAGDKSLLYNDMPVRFSFQSVARSDYPRSVAIAERLSATGSYIP